MRIFPCDFFHYRILVARVHTSPTKVFHSPNGPGSTADLGSPQDNTSTCFLIVAISAHKPPVAQARLPRWERAQQTAPKGSAREKKKRKRSRKGCDQNRQPDPCGPSGFLFVVVVVWLKRRGFVVSRFLVFLFSWLLHWCIGFFIDVFLYLLLVFSTSFLFFIH